MDWRYILSSTMPALQVQSPEFKPQSHIAELASHNFVFLLCIEFFMDTLQNAFQAWASSMSIMLICLSFKLNLNAFISKSFLSFLLNLILDS
jgi:hypothetical protein